MDFFLTHRHIGHIELYKVLIIKGLYIILCVLCAYVLKKIHVISLLLSSLFTNYYQKTTINHL
jgi:hypothetical protein